MFSLRISTNGILLVCTAVGMLMLGACGLAEKNASRTSVEVDSDAIAATFSEYASAWKASDTGRIANLYSDDAVILPGDHVAESGHRSITKYNQEFFDTYNPTSFHLSMRDRKILGDWAFEDGSYGYTATPQKGGKPISDEGKYLVVLQRTADGSWKWFRDIDNSDGSTAVPPGDQK